MRQKILSIAVIFFAAVILNSCFKEDDETPNFLGKQDVTITIDGDESYVLKSGPYYESTGESNCNITRIIFEDIYTDSYKFFFTLEDSDVFDVFSFTFSNSFGGNPLVIGETINSPYFFAAVITFLDNDDKYEVGQFGSTEEALPASLIIDEMFSNGVEKIVDGERLDYPKENIVGMINFNITDKNGKIHEVSMDFNLEGDDIVDGGTESIISESNSSNSANSLSGKWTQVGTCTNSNGDGNYFNFSSSSSGTIFQADCANACSGGGVTTNFNYSISGSNVKITPTKVSNYCGVSSVVPASFTSSWSISGNTLTLDGQDFSK